MCAIKYIYVYKYIWARKRTGMDQLFASPLASGGERSILGYWGGAYIRVRHHQFLLKSVVFKERIRVPP